MPLDCVAPTPNIVVATADLVPWPHQVEALRDLDDWDGQLGALVMPPGSGKTMVMGMHGRLTYDGERLAGMYPHQQVQVAAKAGVDIFGVAVNSSTDRTTPYNLARTVTFLKAATENSPIPSMPTPGWGWGACP